MTQKPDHPIVAPGVRLEDVTFHSAALQREIPYRVFLPANLAVNRTLPVVYLLHGGGDSYRSWSNNSDVSRFAAGGLILVMPEGDDSYYMNEVGNPKERFEDYITQDLLADVERRYPARSDRSGRAVIGISMGGFGAVKYAFSHPNLFCFIAALSPAIDVPFRHYSLRRIGQWWKFRTIFGPNGSAERNARDPSRLLFEADRNATPFIYLTAGEQEPLLRPNQQFAEQLKSHGFAYEFHTKSGGHAWNEWNTQLQDVFAKLSEITSTNK